MRWRPEKYWKPGTTVSVKVNTYGVNLGDGLFGQENVSTNFTIGREMLISADDNTKMVTFRKNGEVIKTMPTSMGKDGDYTDNGIYIVADKHDKIVMDSSTYGVPVNSAEGYRTPSTTPRACPTAASSSTRLPGRCGRRATPTPATAASTSAPRTRNG